MPGRYFVEIKQLPGFEFRGRRRRAVLWHVCASLMLKGRRELNMQVLAYMCQNATLWTLIFTL
jgi:hypothetical protein